MRIHGEGFRQGFSSTTGLQGTHLARQGLRAPLSPEQVRAEASFEEIQGPLKRSLARGRGGALNLSLVMGGLQILSGEKGCLKPPRPKPFKFTKFGGPFGAISPV